MNFSHDQIEELKQAFGEVSYCEEGGYGFFLIPSLSLPDGCSPTQVDALLCPMQRDSYPTRLFFSQEIKPPTSRNWNAAKVRILERNWWAFSWKDVSSELRLIQIVLAHLRGLR